MTNPIVARSVGNAVFLRTGPNETDLAIWDHRTPDQAKAVAANINEALAAAFAAGRRAGPVEGRAVLDDYGHEP